jgi:hypothetical protein
MSGSNSDLKSALFGEFTHIVKMHGENNKLRIQVRESAFAKWALKAW